jgi:hypothetical protein
VTPNDATRSASTPRRRLARLGAVSPASPPNTNDRKTMSGWQEGLAALPLQRLRVAAHVVTGRSPGTT